MAKLTLSDLANITGNEQSAITAINNNSAAIETAMENTLSRDGTTPNTMSADLDLNGYDLLNVGTAFVDGSDILAGASDSELGYVDFVEVSVPNNPSSDTARVYAYDESSSTRLAYKDSAGTVRKIASTSDVTTDNAAIRFDGTSGLLQNSAVIIDDSNKVTAAQYGITSTNPIFLAGPSTATATVSAATDWLWGESTARTQLTSEAAIWAASVYNGLGIAKEFTSSQNSVTPNVGPNNGLFVLAINNNNNNDVVGVLADTLVKTSSQTGFGANFIARNEASTTGVKLVGLEIDLEFASGTTSSTSSAGMILNAFNIGITGPAILLGGVSSGTFANGIVLGGIATTGSGLSPNGAATMDSMFNSGSGVYTTAVGILSNTHRIQFRGTASAHAGIFNDSSNNLRIVGGSAGTVLRNQADTQSNVTVADGGDVTVRGFIKSSSTSSGVGYTTGAGGTVTQATSKTTAVTLDRVSGQITMNNAALAAGATAVFTVNNTAFNAATDTVIAHHASAGTAAAYRIEVLSVSTNAFALGVTNRTAGSLGEALVINFNVIKGSAS